MTTTHSTIETTNPGEPVRRFECPACTFVLDVTAGSRPVPFSVDRGDPTVGHTGAWQDPVLTHR